TVREGEPLLTLHTDDADRFARAQAALEGAVEVAPAGSPYAGKSIIIDRVSA
ncbi:MAG: thymidine phosphorylase, partial [Nocardioidaceae bacterium]|nr:thymidine phosphorylase [Nocardioidaceae bacterium]